MSKRPKRPGTNMASSMSEERSACTTFSAAACDQIKNFEGSVEEKIIRKCMKGDDYIIENIFTNLVIENCNVLKPVSFENADIVLESMYHTLHCLSGAVDEGRQDSNKAETSSYLNVSTDMLFREDIMKKLAAEGIRGCDEYYKPVILSLLTYLHDIRFHEKAIYDMVQTGGDVDTTAVMTQHLFSQLIPGQEYVIDSRIEFLPDVCPCDEKSCKQKIQAGCTSLGSSTTWHGYANVLINQNIELSILERSANPEVKYGDTELKEEPDVPPLKKERKSSGCVSLCVEMIGEQSEQNKNALLSMSSKVLDRVIAETITNAFVQVNRTSALSGWLIPTFSCTTEYISLFLYDPKNDILLQCLNVFPIWTKDGSLNIETVVQLWMYLNFTFFMRKNFADDYVLNKSRFHDHAKSMLKQYQEIESGRDFSGSLDEFYMEVVLPRLARGGKIAKKKTN